MTIGHARGRDAKVTLSVALTTTTTTTTATTATATKRSSGSSSSQRTSLIPPRWESSVRTVGMSECREAALSLAHAFAGDAYAQYLVDDADPSPPASVPPPPSGESSAEDRWKLHVDIMTYAVAAHCLNGLVTTIGPDYDSVALWLPPGRDLDGWWTTLRSGMWRLYFQLSAEGRRRYYDEILPLLHDTKEQVLGSSRSRSAWYLVYLGTKPNSQGRGYARRLLEDMIQRADAENRPMYLESSALANNAYYEKFGFEVKRDVELRRGAVPVRLSIMVREPQPPHQPQLIERKVAAVASHHHTTTTNTTNTKNRTNKIQLVKMG
ncbi:acetyltransferase [Diplogelasinospora grovesii]|uniref:Acetyltransferase n=1 Tax=Diplogelasinospora grovesii TaxID=303347 RepID=A0AAN6NFN0_9PEZI|nr:acetyltransferase [Diplogelasinospora grovesii]